MTQEKHAGLVYRQCHEIPIARKGVSYVSNRSRGTRTGAGGEPTQSSRTSRSWVCAVSGGTREEALYPQAIEECWTAAAWVAASKGAGLGGSRMAIAGDSVGGNLAIALTLLAKQRGGVSFCQQVLFYPVTDANFDTGSYMQFAEGYFLRRDAIEWFWDQYAPDEAQRNEITASPMRACIDELAGLPPALVITGEADVLRDEGEAYANKLRETGVPVTAIRYQGIIHDFVMLNPCARRMPPTRRSSRRSRP
jgi:acetyl esterase/lipase